MKRTISAMRGKGSLTHNRRDFIAENVDSSRTVKSNMVYTLCKHMVYIFSLGSSTKR